MDDIARLKRAYLDAARRPRFTPTWAATIGAMAPSHGLNFTGEWPSYGPRPTPALLLDQGRGVDVWCGVCNETRPLDLAALVQAGKGEMDLEWISEARRLRCIKCGHRVSRLTYLPAEPRARVEVGGKGGQSTR